MPDRLITYSELSSLFMCPKNHNFNYIQGLQPKRRRIPLDEGSAAHTAMQVYYDGGTVPQAIAGFDKIYDDHVAAMQKHGYADYLPESVQKFLRTRALVTVYLETVGPQDRKKYTFDYVEREFQVPIIDPEGKEVPGVKFAGKLDGIWRERTGRKLLMVVEHKFLASFDENSNTLMLDPQVTLYALAAKIAFGVEIPITLYNVCRKPQNKKSGKESDDEFFYRVLEAIKDPKTKRDYFKRVPITRGPQDFKIARELLYYGSQIITGKMPLPYLYRNVGDHCLWKCAFRPPCGDEGNQRLIDGLYEKKPKRHPELEAEEA